MKGERNSLGLRVTAALKSRLEEAAIASGRSQSQEAEVRLERSFLDEKQAEEIATAAVQAIYDDFGGQDRCLYFKLVAKVIAAVEEETRKHWLIDAATFREAESATLTLAKGFGLKAPTLKGIDALRTFTAGGHGAPGELGKRVAKRRLAAIFESDFPKAPPPKTK